MSPLPCGCYEGESCGECVADNDDSWIAHLESRIVWEAEQGFVDPGYWGAIYERVVERYGP